MAKIRRGPRFRSPPMWYPTVRDDYRASSEPTVKFVATEAANWIFHSENDDLLSVILARIDCMHRKKTASLVCKKWLRIEGMTRKTLRVYEPSLLHNLVLRFPNLVEFCCSVWISNENIELVARSYPNLQVIDLSGHRLSRLGNFLKPFKAEDDVNNDGLCSVAEHCTKLTKVGLRWRRNVGDLGVISLLNSAKFLVELDLGRATRITNETFAVIGSNSSLKVLNLGRSSQITLEGFKLLANGATLSKTLLKLVLNTCNGVGDDWCPYMRKFRSLEELILAYSGHRITDVGGAAIASIPTLKVLDIKYVPDITDATLVAIAKNCSSLVSLNVSQCYSITGEGLLAFVPHRCLEHLIMANCNRFTPEQIQELVLGCKTLKKLGLNSDQVTLFSEILIKCHVKWHTICQV